MLIELRTKDSVTLLDSEGIKNAAVKITGSKVDQVASWPGIAGDLKLLFPDETAAPFRATFVTVGADRWLVVRETDSGDLAHIYLGLLPQDSIPRGHIAVLKDAKRSVSVLRRYARGWKGWKPVPRVTSTAELHINREASGISAKPTPSILASLLSDSVTRAALVLVPVVAARVYRTPNLTVGVALQEVGVLLMVLAAIALVDWFAARRQTDWVIGGT